jgi:hypothetical protein
MSDNRHLVSVCTEVNLPGMEYKFGLSGMIYVSSDKNHHKIPRAGGGQHS